MSNGITYSSSSSNDFSSVPFSTSDQLPAAPSGASTKPPTPHDSFYAPRGTSNGSFAQGHGVALNYYGKEHFNPPSNSTFDPLLAALRSNESANSLNTAATDRLAEQLESGFKEIKKLKDELLTNHAEFHKQFKMSMNFMFYVYINTSKKIESSSEKSFEFITTSMNKLQSALTREIRQSTEQNIVSRENLAKRICAPGDSPISSSLSQLSKETEETNKLLAKNNEHAAKAAKAAEKANEKKPPERPKAALPELIAGVTESAARGLVKLVKNTPWAKDALKGICHTSETMIWLVGLGLSLPMILPTILYGTIASLPTIGLSAIALVALATVGKHFMACLKYELKHTPPAPVTAKETAAKAGA